MIGIPSFVKIETPEAPGAVGPYSQAIQTGGMIYVSGQLPLDPATMEFAADDVPGQTAQCLKNAAAILQKAGSGLDRVVKVSVWMTDLGQFTVMNTVYADFFSEPFPARVCCQVAALPRGAQVEIEMIALAD
ncbi:MAG: RidA family protein [Deltaproteobacteria bacterium]|nr:RidA family protein [Deltaproteobacteria bacterium]